MMNSESDEKNLPQKISEDIIDFILNQHLQPGDKLPNEAILSKQLDIGRSSLREAMKLLASRNIVTIKQGSGTYVASSPGIVDDPFGFTFISDKKKLVQDLLEIRFYSNLLLLLCQQPMLIRMTSAKSTDYVMRLKSLWNKKRPYAKRYRIPHRYRYGKQESCHSKINPNNKQLYPSFC